MGARCSLRSSPLSKSGHDLYYTPYQYLRGMMDGHLDDEMRMCMAIPVILFDTNLRGVE